MNGGSVSTGVGVLTILNPYILATSGELGPAFLYGNLTLASDPAAFDVTAGSNVVDLCVNSAVIAGAITKTGSGLLRLASANTISGQTIVSNGVLEIGNAGALGSAAAGTTVYPGGTLQLSNVLSLAEPLTFAGGGLASEGTCSCVPTVAFTTNLVINVLSSVQF